MAAQRGPMKRRPAVLVRRRRRRAGGEQRGQCVQVTARRCVLHRRVRILVPCVGVRAARQQQLHDGCVAGRRRDGERRAAARRVCWAGQARAAVQRSGRSGRVACLRRRKQRVVLRRRHARVHPAKTGRPAGVRGRVQRKRSAATADQERGGCQRWSRLGCAALCSFEGQAHPGTPNNKQLVRLPPICGRPWKQLRAQSACSLR